MVVETAALSEVERGEYCRKRGIYPEHLQAWCRACEQANGGLSPRTHGERSAERRRIQALERERRRKEKALAETGGIAGAAKKSAGDLG